MRSSLFSWLILLQMPFAFRVQADFQLPIDQAELAPFFKKMLSGKIDLKGRDGCYALPVGLKVFGTEELRYLKIDQNIAYLARSPSDLYGFALANYPSLDKIINLESLGDLMTSITLPEGRDFWEVLAQSGSIPPKGIPFSHAEGIRVRFCTVRNSKLCFFWFLFVAKMTDDLVDGAKKPLSDPLVIRVDCIDIGDAGIKEKSE